MTQRKRRYTLAECTPQLTREQAEKLTPSQRCRLRKKGISVPLLTGKPGRLILSASFTVEQVKAVLDLVTALNLGKDARELFERDEVGHVYQKFLRMEQKWKRGKMQWEATNGE